MSENKQTTKVKIPCRISFANIWEPKSINGSDEKYSVSCIISKKDTKTISAINAAIEAANEAGKVKKWGGKIPAGPGFKLPLRDGDIERSEDEAYAGSFFVNANSKDKPQVVDRHVQPITDPLDCGSGDYCFVTINFYPFNANGNRGIAAGLGNIQKVRDGERLAGRATAASDFEEINEDDLGEVFGGETPGYLK